MERGWSQNGVRMELAVTILVEDGGGNSQVGMRHGRRSGFGTHPEEHELQGNMEVKFLTRGRP